ncbi:MAG: hypothetical protein ACQESF_00655 [Nanobdellota archaeon]
MRHKTHHHKMFITLFLLLVMGVGFLLGRGVPVSGEFQMIMLFANTTFLVIITHFLLEIYSGNRVLEVVDVTPKSREDIKPQRSTKTSARTAKRATKKSTKKKATKKKKSSKRR